MTIDLDAMREKVPYLGWWLGCQAGPSGPVVFEWYATEDNGDGLFDVSVNASALALDRLQRWEEAKRYGLAAVRGKIFLNTWQQNESYSLSLPIEEMPIKTAEIRAAILEGLYRLYELGFEARKFTVDLEGIAVELRTNDKLVLRAVEYLYERRLIEDYGTVGRNRSTGDIWLSTSGVDHSESVAARGREVVVRADSGNDDETDKSDVFICHAGEDKDDVARPLASALSEHGLEVWYDEFSLSLGDSLRRSIDRGIAGCRYGVVILSPNFFAKKWPNWELDGLVTREVRGGKTILPVWHSVTKREIEQFSPSLADKVGVSTSKGLDAVVKEILRVLQPD